MPLSYSGDLVCAHDRDRYLTTLFMPPGRRPALWALYAFNYEIARTREVVSDTTLGLIRLQWWRDAFAAVYDGKPIPEHEIMRDLAPAILAGDLPRDLFDQLLYAREFDLEDVAPSNLQGLDAYAGFTNIPLLQLARAIGGETGGGDDAIAAAARAYGLAGLLRAVPFHARQRRCFLPADLLRLEGLAPDDLYDGRASGLPTVVRAVHDHARSLLRDVRPAGRLARMTAALADMHLKAIRAADFNVFTARLTLPPPFREIRLLMASLRG